MKTKVEIAIHPFRLQGVGVFLYTKVITTRNRMRTYEIIPYTELFMLMVLQSMSQKSVYSAPSFDTIIAHEWQKMFATSIVN